MSQATNYFSIIGRAIKKPEVKKTQGGKDYAYITVAVNKGKDKADFLTVMLWESTAVNTNKYVNKGDMVAIAGHLASSTYNDKPVMQLVGESVSFISSPKKESAPESSAPKAEPAPALDPAADFYSPVSADPFGL